LVSIQANKILFTVGHIATSFILTYAISRKFSLRRVSIPFIMLLSILPDIDVVFQALGFFVHKTVSHSLIVSAAIGVILILKYRKPAIVLYSIAYVQHILIGDTVIESLNILYPFGFFILGLGIKYASFYHIMIEFLLVSIMSAIVVIEYLYNKQNSIFLQRYYKIDSLIYWVVILSIIISPVYMLYQVAPFGRLFLNTETLIMLIVLHVSSASLIIFIYIKSRLVSIPE
jgi:hypothetical protein